MPKLMAETNMLSTALPYHTTSDNLNFIFNDYLTFEKERSGWTFPNVVRWLAEAPENGKLLKMSAADRKMCATYDSIAKVAEKLRNEEAARYMYEDDANKAVVKYCSNFYNANIQKKPDVMRLMIAEDIKREWAIMDACNTTATIRDVQKATIVNKMIETYGISLPKDIVASLPNEIHSKYLRKLLTDANQKLIDYEQQTETEQPALQDNRPVESMTDGREIFEKIIAPYKGKVIYLDVWGTWCTPCKKEMKNVPALKETLKGIDVVFLYLCNGSSDESLKNNIKQFGLTGKNVVHYNLPASQQAALEKYIGLEGYPTYKLIDRNGRIMPGRCPRPSQPDMVKTAIEQLQE
jgi:thiol-disulfide isomerase/thioredoxin